MLHWKELVVSWIVPSCCDSHSQSGLGDVDKTRTFEFHSLKNEREMEFCMYYHEYAYSVKTLLKVFQGPVHTASLSRICVKNE